MKTISIMFCFLLFMIILKNGAFAQYNGGSYDGYDMGSWPGDIAYINISGVITGNNLGLSGVTVTLNGSSSMTITTDASGFYSFSVNPGVTFTITPSRINYIFSPVGKTFTNITSDEVQNFSAIAFAESLEGIKVSPIPFIPSKGHTKIMFAVPDIPLSKIKIFDKAATLVKTIEEKQRSSIITWDGVGDNGYKQGSGVYLWILTT